MQRRDLLKGLAATSAAAALVSCSKAGDEETNNDDQAVDFLFVQNAIAVTLSEGVLSMIGITPETLYFSDRPDRIVGRVTTQEFVDHWSKGEDSFAANPPNAVLSILQHPVPQDVVVVLREPQLQAGALSYNVEILDGVAEIDGGASALFIDIIGRPLTPLSVAGVRRRTRRRTRRRVG
jgi:hypothetical protein